MRQNQSKLKYTTLWIGGSGEPLDKSLSLFHPKLEELYLDIPANCVSDPWDLAYPKLSNLRVIDVTIPLTCEKDEGIVSKFFDSISNKHVEKLSIHLNVSKCDPFTMERHLIDNIMSKIAGFFVSLFLSLSLSLTFFCA